MTPKELREEASEKLARLHLENLEKARGFIEATMNDPGLRTDPARKRQIQALMATLKVNEYEADPGVSAETRRAISSADAKIFNEYLTPYEVQYAELGGKEVAPIRSATLNPEQSAYKPFSLSSLTGGLKTAGQTLVDLGQRGQRVLTDLELTS